MPAPTVPITLTRVERLVLATAPDGTAPPRAAAAYLAEKLTYYERKYDFASFGDTGDRFTHERRQLYHVDPRSGAVVFPLGLRPRIAAGLQANGFAVTYPSPSLTAAKPEAYELDWDGLFQDFELYTGQDECLARISGADGGVVSAATGYGKSVVIKMLCRWYFKARVHVVTKSVTLAEQIVADIARVVPAVGMVGGGVRRFGRVTVFVADSLHHGAGVADLCLLDEVHELAAPKYAKLLREYRTARMFGFSATPTGRMDGRDMEVEALCGPVLYTIDYQAAQAAGRVVPITVEWIRPPRGPDLRYVQNPVARERTGIWQNHTRNRTIADRAARIPADEQTLIMVKTIDHAARLKQLLPDYTLCYGADGMDAARLRGYVAEGVLPADEPLMTRARLKALREQYAAGTLKKVIANRVWSTGVDFRLLSVMIRADAAASEIMDGQMPGRICRRVPGIKESALLIDVEDDWDPGFGRKSQDRRRNYRKRGWAQVTAPVPLGAGA